MKAVIVGCGKVGSALAATLVNDGHSVAIIDTNQKALDRVAEEIDFLPLCGNGGDISMLREAGVAVLPGNAFGACGEGYIRIACTCSVDVLREAFDRIGRVFVS